MTMDRLRDRRGLFVSQPKKYEALLGFESMKYWDMVLRTPKTKDFYFSTMSTFLEWVSTPEVSTPDELLALSRVEAVDRIRKFSFKYDHEGKAKMAQMVKTVFKSFFAANNRELKSSHLKVHKVSRTKKTYTKIVPTKTQVYAMADAATNLRDRAVVLTLWQSGLRNATLRNLAVDHVKEGLVEGHVPLKIDVTPDIDKKNLREPYYTFIDQDAIEAIKRYLHARGDIPTIASDEPLFASNLRTDEQPRPMSDTSVRRAVKNAARNAGINPKRIWPHCLRSAFYNMLVGKVDDVEREFLFGHALGVRNHYFAPQWTDKLRAAYLAVGWRRLSTTLTKEDVRTEVISALMGKLGDAELAPIAGKLGITPQQIRAMIQRIRVTGSAEETEALLQTERAYYNDSNGESKLVSEEALCKHINEGWELVKELASGKILMKKTN
jgi:site-specific recombinase XerD